MYMVSSLLRVVFIYIWQMPLSDLHMCHLGAGGKVKGRAGCGGSCGWMDFTLLLMTWNFLPDGTKGEHSMRGMVGVNHNSHGLLTRLHSNASGSFYQAVGDNIGAIR